MNYKDIESHDIEKYRALIPKGIPNILTIDESLYKNDTIEKLKVLHKCKTTKHLISLFKKIDSITEHDILKTIGRKSSQTVIIRDIQSRYNYTTSLYLQNDSMIKAINDFINDKFDKVKRRIQIEYKPGSRTLTMEIHESLI